MLELHQIKKYYGQFCALDGLDMTVEDGALYGFAGPNGAGKTTAIKIMTGILFPDEGYVTIDGEKPGADNVRLRERIGYVQDSFGSYARLTVQEYMEFFASCYDITGLSARNRVAQLLEYVHLEDRADFYLDALSMGMKQKLSLARALLHDPAYLIMDEPTSGLDPVTRYEFKQMAVELSDRGKTIVMSSHILSDLAEICTDVGIIDHGKMMICGNMMKVMQELTTGTPIIIGLMSGIGRAVELLKKEKMVRSVTVRGQEIMIGFDGNMHDEAELLKKLISQGLSIRSFSREKSSLESIFIQLTGHGSERLFSGYEAAEEEI